MEQENSKKGTGNPPKESSNHQLSGKDDSKKDTNHDEGSSKPELSEKNTPQSLKSKSKIVKKSKAGKFKTITNKGFQQIGGKKRNMKNMKVVGKTDEPPKEKIEKAEKNKEKESQNGSTGYKSPIEKSHWAKNNKIIKLDESEQKQKNEANHRESDKGADSGMNKDKHSGMENMESREKKSEKLGGFIFMCNAKTKPDCFRYRVMGVSVAKKDIILGVKPGTKLFLFDFDLKLLYGIYKASSSGGMKLEPCAFGGNFPAQVRFNVASDCFPLPESIFKKAIKENYDEKNKFKTELTLRQVRKLSELFRPVNIHSALQPVHSPSRAVIQEREASDGVRGSWHHLQRERPAGDPYINSNVRSYNVLSHERDPQIERQEEIPRDLFLTEKSYRAHGLQGDRRNATRASLVNHIPDPYQRDYERDYQNVPPHVDSLPADPLHLRESEHQTYFRGATSEHVEDPHHAYRYGTSARDPYLQPLSREEISSSSYLFGGRTLLGTENLERRETVQDRLHSTYSAADALSEYNRMQHYHGDEASDVRVSSRYSFAGPSYSLR
ncbi:uncharacterized protein LOC133311591 [Gastrolobium bilobum]|uniref:uncharacterized protein LOC133311591 n=1 Tax=Gastrolobium bilobum TaxID=150636 RepID=UPI002AB134D4|nr:uncharacterized protein LOC133311591 [Gastrolobium bilobum]